MATLEAWADRGTMKSLFQNLQQSIEHYIGRFEELIRFKTDVLDDAIRKAEMKKLIDEDPDWDFTKILDKYNQFKVIYDYLESQKP